MNDLKFAFRQLLKNPGFTAVAVLTLALGIGLVSTQFTLIDGVLLRPLPFPDADRLYHVARVNENRNESLWQSMTAAEFLHHHEQQTSFDSLAGFDGNAFNLNHAGGPPRRVNGSLVTANFFSLLRVAPQAGRVFQAGEDRAGQPLLVVLGDAVWREEFGADPAVVGRAVRLNGEPATVIGVMPAGFRFPNRDECWANLRLEAQPAADQQPQRLAALGLLKEGVSLRTATAELDALARQHQTAFPAEDARPARMIVQTFARASNDSGGTTTLFATMLAMTGFVLALACVNVANLLHARAAGRTRELAVRAALGADRGRLFRQLFGESLLLTAGGTLLGVLFAGVGARLLDSHTANQMEVAAWMKFDLNGRVLLFTVLVSAAAGVLAGVLPAFRAVRLDLVETLKDDSRGATGAGPGRWGRWLVTAQMALAGGLLVVASLLALSAIRSSRINLPFSPDSLLLGRLELHGPQYEEPAARTRFYQQLVDRVRATPGVAAAAVSSRNLVNQGVYSQFELEGAVYASPREKPGAWLEVVSREYFSVVERAALAGRLFGAEDMAASQPVALVNRSFADKHWPGADPLGKRIRRVENDAPWATVIGVVPDLTMEGVGNSDPGAGWYLLQDQQAWGWMDLLVRAEGDPAAIIPSVRAAVAAIDPEQPIHTLSSLRIRTERRVAGLQIVGTMAGAFAATAVLLAGVGIYGVMAFAVRRRTREFGVRLALGSTAPGILALLFRQNALRTLVGVAAGLIVGYALALPLAPLLPKVSTTDHVVYLGVAALLFGVASLAIGLPARRAAQTDPMVALRAE